MLVSPLVLQYSIRLNNNVMYLLFWWWKLLGCMKYFRFSFHPHLLIPIPVSSFVCVFCYLFGTFYWMCMFLSIHHKRIPFCLLSCVIMCCLLYMYNRQPNLYLLFLLYDISVIWRASVKGWHLVRTAVEPHLIFLDFTFSLIWSSVRVISNQ